VTDDTILIVEDEFFVALTLEDVLQSAGFQVRVANSGDEAVDMLTTMPLPPLALVTDIRLPGVLGWDVARTAREKRGDVPVIYISGDSGKDWAANGVQDSMFLQKPFRSDELVDMLRMLVKAPQA
jgi:CheY-like chemotaxis protein